MVSEKGCIGDIDELPKIDQILGSWMHLVAGDESGKGCKRYTSQGWQIGMPLTRHIKNST
jgi:hypothetical protein